MMNWIFYLLARPFVYLYALVRATVEVLQGEKQYAVIDDARYMNVRFFNISEIPILMFCDNNRPLPNFIVGREIDSIALAPLLDRCWKQYRQEQHRQEQSIDQKCMLIWGYKPATKHKDEAFWTYKPDFFRTIYYFVNEKRLKEQEVQRIQQEAKERAEQVRQWLDAGADINTTVKAVDDRKYNLLTGYTALKLAKAYEEDWIVRLLVSNDAKP